MGLALSCGASLFATANGQDALRFTSITIAPQSRVQPGGTLLLLASIVNSGDTPAEGVLVTTFPEQTLEQSARRVSIAPNTSEQVEVYVQLPASIKGATSIEFTMTMNVDYAGREVVLQRNGLPVIHTLRLPVDQSSSNTAFALDASPVPALHWKWPQHEIHSSYELAVAARVDAGHTRISATFDTQALPLSSSDWSAFKEVVIADPEILDQASIEPLKKFVSSGGRIWIMLDQVPTEAVRPLLAAEQTCETLDEIELNEFAMEMLDTNVNLVPEDRRVAADSPFKMKRVIQTGGRVSHRVNGWPAAIWMELGHGEILLTTVDSRAWIEPRQVAVADVLRASSHTTRVWARELAANFNATAQGFTPATALDYPLTHIGNPVVPRAWVATALLSFCGLLVLLGAWRASSGDLSSVGFLAPLAAGLASIALLIASSYVRSDMQETVAKLQVIQVTEDGMHTVVREQAAVYGEGEVEMSLSSAVDGRAKAEGVTSGIRRFETSDFQQWNFSSKAWPTGPWRYDAEYSLPVEGLVVTARLNDRGVELSLPPLPSALEDLVLAFAVGDPMLCSSVGGRVLADGSLSARGQQWMAATLMSDEQQRRTAVYQDYFRPDQEFPSIKQVLLGWTAVWPGGPSWSHEFPLRGAALVALPVHLERPKVGTEVYVPHGMIGLGHADTQVGRTFAFNEDSGTWVDELSLGTVAPLSFNLPQQVVPFAASSIELDLDIKAPNRIVKVLGSDADGAQFQIAELVSPSIPWKTTLTDPRILADARDGRISVTVEVGERTDAESPGNFSSVVTWRVDHFRASVRGSVAPSSSLAQAAPPTAAREDAGGARESKSQP